MWNTSIIGKTKQVKGQAVISVSFENSIDSSLSFVEDYAIDSGAANTEWLKRQIKFKINTMDSVYGFVDSLLLGNFDLTPAPIPKPTQDEIDRQAYADNLLALIKAKSRVTLGVKSDKNQDYIDLVQAVKDAYKPEYDDIVPAGLS